MTGCSSPFFNVYRRNDGVLVTVLEGHVEATSGVAVPDRGNDGRVQLRAGERARLAANTAIRTERLEHPERSIDWHSRRLVFEQAPLAEVISEFNRYNDVPLELASPDLAAKRINGIFDAGDRASLVRFLQEFEQVEVETKGGKLMLRRRE
jgi:transmembrane sensor